MKKNILAYFWIFQTPLTRSCSAAALIASLCCPSATLSFKSVHAGSKDVCGTLAMGAEKRRRKSCAHPPPCARQLTSICGLGNTTSMREVWCRRVRGDQGVTACVGGCGCMMLGVLLLWKKFAWEKRGKNSGNYTFVRKAVQEF